MLLTRGGSREGDTRGQARDCNTAPICLTNKDVGMRINTNISAVVTQGSLFRVNRSMGKSLERLSTGLRINSAADDAAGLGVSENLRAQVRGLGQALKNSQDVIAMLNIADGALGEQADILGRMRELVLQARNDTYTATERGYMGTEFVALAAELDRIANVTNYNGMQLFAAEDRVYTGNDATATPTEVADQRGVFDNVSDAVLDSDNRHSSNHFNMMIGGNYTAADAAAFNDPAAAALGVSGYNSWDKDSPNMITIQFNDMGAEGLLSPGYNQNIYRPGDEVNDWFYGFGWDPSLNHRGDLWIDLEATPGAGNDTIQAKFDFLMNVIDGTTEDLSAAMQAHFGGLTGTTGLKRVNAVRASIGATINRMQHNVNNLMSQIANTQSAESVVRDVDFAKESTTFSRNQILTQSATAMLAQANIQPNSVLSLLR